MHSATARHEHVAKRNANGTKEKDKMPMDKNKTCNLIRAARTLATVLDVRIQDIITGNTEVNDDGVVDANNAIHFD